MCIGIDTRNEAENYGQKCVFIGEFKYFDPDEAQRSSLSESPPPKLRRGKGAGIIRQLGKSRKYYKTRNDPFTDDTALSRNIPLVIPDPFTNIISSLRNGF
jgi:hypothetical protein